MRYRNGELEDLTPLLEALDLATRRNSIVSFIGAGGKRIIIEEIIKEYEKNKRKIVVTTTTRVRKPFQHKVILDEDIQKVKEELLARLEQAVTDMLPETLHEKSVSLAKLKEMKERCKTGFTSFWS